MKNNLFDGYVKEQMGSYRPEVPAHIWENISAQNDKRRPLVFWKSTGGNLFAAIILLMLGGAVFYFAQFNFSYPNNIKPEQNTAVTQTKSAENILVGSVTSLAGNTIHNITPGNTLQNTNSIPLVQNASSAGKNTILYTHTFMSNNNGTVANTNDMRKRAADEYGSEVPLVNSFNEFYLLRSSLSFKRDLQMPLLPRAANIPCPEQDAAGNKKYIEFYAGPDYAFRSYSDTAASAYMQQRKASTNLLFAYSAGVRYTKVFSNGICIRAGINYSAVNETFKSVKGHVTQNVYITNNNGDTIGTSTVTGTQYKQSTNKYRSIDIPVAVGYELGNGKLHANVNAGAVINIHSKQTGFVLDLNGNPVDLNSGKTNAAYKYKTNAGIGLTGAFSVYYKLSNRFHILAEPYIKYSLSPITKPDLTLKEKYHAAGLRIGLRVDL